MNFDFLNHDPVAKAAADAANAALAAELTGFWSGSWPRVFGELRDRLERVRRLSNQAHEEEETKR